MDWKKFCKRLATSTGKGVIKGVKLLSRTIKETMQNRKFKEEILIRLSNRRVYQLAREKKIKLNYPDRRPTADDYRRAIKNRVSLDEIISFAKRYGIYIDDILMRIEEARLEKELEKLGNLKKQDEFFVRVIECIKDFKPFRRYDHELPYQVDLARHLKAHFPDTKIEEARGSARPDIVIGGIAIEVKGPTFDKDLQTISDKCMRYSHYFPRGMIVVLFDLHVARRRYEDWLKGMKNKFPEVIIIKK